MSDPATYVYDLSEGSASMKSLLGGKGANVAEMTRIGVPVPDGFTVTTAACVEAMRSGGEWPQGLLAEHRGAACAGSRSAPAGSSAPASGRCWCRSAPAPCTPCPG